MKKEESLNLKNFGKFIGVVIKRLDNGRSRFSDTIHPEFPLSSVCLRDFDAPDYSERLKSDYGVPSNSNEVQKDFFDEIKLIEELIDEYKIPVKFAEWQKNSSIAETDSIHKGLNKRNLALQIWEWYAIPWRFKNEKIYLIWPQHDVMGAPIIKDWSVDYFLRTMAIISELQGLSQIKTTKQLEFWKGLGYVSIAIFIIYIVIRLN